jgi:hypothetical protein
VDDVQYKGTYTFSSGEKMEGVYSGKRKDGGYKYFDATAIHDNGEKYYGRFDMETGTFEGKYINISEEVFEGKIIEDDNGTPIGNGSTTYVNGDKYNGRQYEYEGKWLKDGNGKIYYTNGEIIEGIWKDDKLIKVIKKTKKLILK